MHGGAPFTPPSVTHASVAGNLTPAQRPDCGSPDQRRIAHLRLDRGIQGRHGLIQDQQRLVILRCDSKDSVISLRPVGLREKVAVKLRHQIS